MIAVLVYDFQFMRTEEVFVSRYVDAKLLLTCVIEGHKNIKIA